MIEMWIKSTKNAKQYLKSEKLVMKNFQYGLANHEMQKFAQISSLTKLKSVINHQKRQKVSKKLLVNIRDKSILRGYTSRKLPELLKKGIIKTVLLKSLDKMA